MKVTLDLSGEIGVKFVVFEVNMNLFAFDTIEKNNDVFLIESLVVSSIDVEAAIIFHFVE